MSSIRVAPDNLNSIIAAWDGAASLVFRGLHVPPEQVRAACWDAGMVARIEVIDGDIYRATLVERVA